MSLATRCPSCATAFRVVQDQLKVSEGWVRCGRCDNVFNALEGLFDLGRDPLADEADPPVSARAGDAPAAAPWTAAPAHGEARPEEEDDDEEEGGPTSDLGELLADPIDAHLFGPRKRAESAPKPAGQLDMRDRVEFSDARFDSDLFAENTSVPDTQLAVADGSDALPLETAQRPEFVRRAERSGRWGGPKMRAALAGASALALLALVAQIGHHFRDSIAARAPALRAPLVAWCGLAGCSLEAPRRIDEVIVETTALSRSATQDAFLLAVTVRSRSALAVALPAVDLTLTDVNGRLVARRVLTPRDFLASPVLAPGGEAALQVALSAGTAAVVGYTVEIFYP